jgi:uncharacterized membrane protein YfbV (UPF0208 family)
MRRIAGIVFRAKRIAGITLFGAVLMLLVVFIATSWMLVLGEGMGGL